MFENKEIRGINISRYVASWMKVGGGPVKYTSLDGGLLNTNMADWLRELKFIEKDGNLTGLTDDEICDIVRFAENGKLELQEHCKIFLKEQEG